MERVWAGAALWSAPRIGHEARLTLGRATYRSTSGTGKIRSTRALASYRAELFPGLRAGLAAGLEDLDDNEGDEYVLRLDASGKIGDHLTGSLSFDRDLVTDTVAALRRGITRQTLAGGVVFEPLARLSLEGGYFVTDYSDNNWTAGYDLKAGYVLSAEPRLLRIAYLYSFKESDDGMGDEDPARADGFSADDHPYWSPKNHWQNQFGVEFRHLLSTDSTGKWTSERFYSLEYYLGHDSDGYAVQSGRGALRYRVDDHFEIEAAGRIVSSSPFRAKELSLSLDYRW